MDVADHATYSAKKSGRDGWVGMSAAGDFLPEGPLSPANLDAWFRAGRLTAETSRAGLD